MKEVKVQFVKHKSARDIVIAYARFDHPRMKEERLLSQEVGLDLKFDDNEYHSGTVEELIGVVEKLGIWGFCDKITHGATGPDIHYWISSKEKANRIKVMELFGHEIGHAIGYSSENMAIKFGGVAGFAYMSMMEEVYDEDPVTGKKIKKSNS